MTQKASVITMPDRQTVLAGRGAWTPDGRSLAVARRDTGDETARWWELRIMDPDTGHVTQAIGRAWRQRR